MRMIDADALLTEIRKKEAEPNYQHTGEDWCVGLIIAEGLVDEQPTIEPQQWIPFHKRELTEEEQEMYPEWSYYLDCELPEDGEEILISSPTWGVYEDTFNNEGSDGCYLEGDEEIDDGMAWQPLPDPWKGEEE